MKKLWVKSASGKALHLVYRPETGNEWFYLSIGSEMAAKGVPVEIPDVDFFHTRIASGELATVLDSEAREIYSAYHNDVEKRHAEAEVEARNESAEEAEIVEAVAETVKEIKRKGRPPKEVK